MVEIKYNRGIERVESVGNVTDVWGYKTCKSMRTFIEKHIRDAVKKQDIHSEVILKGMLQAYNHFHPIIESAVEIKGWHGKSSFEIVKGIDKLTIIKYQKKDKETSPREMRFEFTREELISLINSIKLCSEWAKEREFITTKEIAFQFCIERNLTDFLMGDFRKNFYSNRIFHYRFTLMLDTLEKFGLISYNAGKIKLLNNQLNIQMIL